LLKGKKPWLTSVGLLALLN